MRNTHPDADTSQRGRRHRRGAGHTARRVAAVGLSALLVGGVAPAAFATTSAAPAASAATTTGWAGDTPNSTGGTDYFVDATGGDDAHAGTARSSAWKTFDKVNATTFQPGDRILLKAGETWSSTQLWPKGSGVAGKPIVIDAYGDESARRPSIAANGAVPSPFDANGVKNPDTVGLTGAVVLRNQQYWSIANLEVSNDDDFATDITTGRYVRDGIAVSINADKFPAGTAAADTVMHGITVSNVFAHDIDGPSSWQKIHYAGVNFQVFGQKQYTEYSPGGYHFENIRIENNRFEKVELHAVQFAFNWFGDQLGQTDEAGKFHEGWEQLWVRDRDLYSRDVYIGHNYAESIGQGPYQFANTQRLTAEYNEANTWLQRYSGVSAGLYLWAGADSVMRFNEIYGGPANEYDATPWDLEYTNFNVVYEHNYSHDNQGGWMSYMGNSSNSIARYNLSVNDNGVVFKNMLSTNYSPTYVLNNVIVYDGAELESFHDEVLKDRVYFANNVFYNTSTTTSTNWARKPGGLDKGVFSNNVYYEASGKHSANQPADPQAVTADPQFTGDPAAYSTTGGVDGIRQSASLFTLKDTSPLIDAGRYNVRIGSEDFFGTDLYYGDGVDIGLQETKKGSKVDSPVDTDPIENEGIDPRIDLALNKPVVASSTHPHNNFEFSADKLVDGDPATRWAAADDATYPLTIDIDFGAETTFDEVDLAEFSDAGTNYRVSSYQLERWDAQTQSWVAFSTQTDGIGGDRVVDDFGSVTSSRLRLSITGLLPGEIYAPTMTGIRVYDNAAAVTHPTVTPTTAVVDLNASMAGDPRNLASFIANLDGDTLTGLRYVTPAGAIVGSLDSADYTREDGDGTALITLTPAFAADKQRGASGVLVEFASNQTVRVTVEITDTTDLEAAIGSAKAITAENSDGYRALATAFDAAQAVLAQVNRDTVASGNTAVTDADVVAATAALTAAVASYAPGTVTPGTPTPTPTPGTGTGTGTGPTRPIDIGAPGAPGTSAPATDDPAPGAAAAESESTALASTGFDGVATGTAAAILLLAGVTALSIRTRGSRAARLREQR